MRKYVIGLLVIIAFVVINVTAAGPWIVRYPTSRGTAEANAWFVEPDGDTNVPGTLAVAGQTSFAGGAKLASIGVASSSLTFVAAEAGLLYRDGSNNVYVSTSTGAGGVIKVGAQ